MSASGQKLTFGQTRRVSALCQQQTSAGASLIFGKSIQSCLHYLEGCIHCRLLIAGNLLRQEVSNPHHARSTVLGEGLE